MQFELEERGFRWRRKVCEIDIPTNTVLRIWPLVLALFIIKKGILLREIQRLSPIDDLTVGVMSVLGAERGPANETFKHDSSNRPPVAGERVALTAEDFRGDIVGSADSRVSQDTTS